MTLHFAEAEEVKKGGKDFILDIDIRPNRAGDCFSHIGIAREIATILGLNFKVPSPKPREEKKIKAKEFIEVKIQNKEDCFRYTARIITNVKVRPSPKWIQDRLAACGLRPINNIVDATNYIMLETGQPLHAFDLDKLSESGPGQKLIVVRRAKKGEKITTLENQSYSLNEGVLIIADSKEPLAIAGIKGGKKAEIDKKTRNIVLESANFNPLAVRNGSAKLNLKTDSSWRFEHGIDPNLAEFSINRVAELIQKISGGKIVEGLIDNYLRKVLPRKVLLDLNYLKTLLGIEISKKETIKILNNLGFETRGIKQKMLEVSIPTRRLDVVLAEDLIEEIGRIYGYEKIPARPLIGAFSVPKRNDNVFWQDMAKNILKEAGFSEVYNYSFVSERGIKTFGYSAADLVEIENPISSNQKYLRPSLISNLLKNTKENLKYFNELNFFELGKTFNKKTGEKLMLSGIISRKKKGIGAELFYEAKGIVDLLLNGLGISDIWYDEYGPTPEDSKIKIWVRHRCAEIKSGGGQELGFLGEVSRTLLEDLEIKEAVVVFDIDFEKLQKLVSEEHEYRPISQHPSAIRDIAVLVPRGVSVDEVLQRIELCGGNLVRDVDVFDIYEGEEIPEGKKNLAFHIIFQAEDRTLKPEEINWILEKIRETLEENLEWEVRK